jgi:hypothetical protein
MLKEKFNHFFKPSPWKLLIFGVFMFIAFAGDTVSWCFSGKDAGLPKPILYDFLISSHLDILWVIWVELMLPLSLLSNILVSIGGYETDFIMRGPHWLFWIIQIIYFYIIACIIYFLGKILIRKLKFWSNTN